MNRLLPSPKVTDSHRAAIEGLAHDLDLPVDDVEAVFHSEMKRIESGARIKTFVSVLTVGSVRNRLRRPRRARPSGE
jgi:hypothetical protein